jgi:hypothetical protein
VVGRFIEQQQVGAANQRLREVKTHTPAAGEIADRTFKLFVRKTQTVQQAGGARTDGPGVDGVQLAVDGGDGVASLRSLAAFSSASRRYSRSPSITYSRVPASAGQGFPDSPTPAASYWEGKTTAIGADLVFQKRQQRDLPQPFLPTRPTF